MQKIHLGTSWKNKFQFVLGLSFVVFIRCVKCLNYANMHILVSLTSTIVILAVFNNIQFINFFCGKVTFIKFLSLYNGITYAKKYFLKFTFLFKHLISRYFSHS